MGDSDVYRRDHCTTLYRALRHWIATAFPFSKAHYSNMEIPPPDDEVPGTPIQLRDGQ